MPSTTVIDKAARLFHEGRVIPHGPARQYSVLGETGDYWVVIAVAEDLHTCSCPAYGTCSHIAACLLADDERAPSQLAAKIEAAISRLGGEGMDAVAFQLLSDALAEATTR